MLQTITNRLDRLNTCKSSDDPISLTIMIPTRVLLARSVWKGKNIAKDVENGFDHNSRTEHCSVSLRSTEMFMLQTVAPSSASDGLVAILTSTK